MFTLVCFKKSKLLIFLLSLTFFLANPLYSETNDITKKQLQELESKFSRHSNSKFKKLYRSKLYSFLKKQYEKGKFKSTLEFCKKATYYFPEDKELRNIVSDIYFKYAQIKEKTKSSKRKKEQLNNNRKDNKVTKLLNKAFRYFKENKLDKSKTLLKRVLSIDKDKNFALYLLGKILIKENKLTQGLKYWKKISEENVTIDIEKQIEQVKKEVKLQKGFKKISWKNFNFYAPANYSNISYSLRSKVNQVYREIGRDFDYYPKYQIPIILYPKEKFEKLSDKLYPVAGLYDGKIRLPLNNKKTLYRILRHEYTHLILKDLTHGNIPIWMKEGIAEYETGVPKWRKEKLKKYCLKKNIIPIKELKNIFTSRNSDLIPIAYTEVSAFIGYILNRYDRHTLLQIIKDFKNEKSAQQILKKRINKNLNQLTTDVETYIKNYY